MLMFRPFVTLLCAVVTWHTLNATQCVAKPSQLDVSAELMQRQQKLTAAIEKVRGAVVGVSDGLGVGSGVVVSPDGIVLTASHVVDSPTRGRLRSESMNKRITITFPDGNEYRAEVLGKNRNADAAMLRITQQRTDGKPFPFVEMGRSEKLQQGDPCFAMGNPGGWQKERPAPIRIGRILSIGHRTLVSDCSIVLGDSGGPLFDLEGRVIGIHSMITSIIIENRHVAIDVWHRDWQRFMDSDRWGTLRAYDNRLVESDFFGVGLKWQDFSASVSRVIPDSPADDAGLQPGDAVVSINRQQFADRLDLGTLLAEVDDASAVDVVIDRNNDRQILKLVTGNKQEALDAQRERRRRRDFNQDEIAEREEEFTLQLSPHRPIGPFEKRAPEQLALFNPVLNEVRDSVVAIKDGGPTICLGVVMSSDGYILTKASEVRNAIAPECILPDGQRFNVREVASNDAYDLMLIKVDGTNLQPAVWKVDSPAAIGTLAIVPDARGNPLIPTVVSVETRTQASSSKGFLGVQLQPNSNGVQINSVISGGAAERNGLRADDVILSIDGITMQSVGQIIDKVSQTKPGQKIAVRYLREDKISTINITLTPRFTSEDAMLEQYRSLDPELMGQFASIHSGGFPNVLQHDADVFPEQCGGPLVGLDGRLLGLNIARADRVVSYAIPAKNVLEVYRELRSRDSSNPL